MSTQVLILSLFSRELIIGSNFKPGESTAVFFLSLDWNQFVAHVQTLRRSESKKSDRKVHNVGNISGKCFKVFQKPKTAVFRRRLWIAEVVWTGQEFLETETTNCGDFFYVLKRNEARTSFIAKQCSVQEYYYHYYHTQVNYSTCMLESKKEYTPAGQVLGQAHPGRKKNMFLEGRVVGQKISQHVTD